LLRRKGGQLRKLLGTSRLRSSQGIYCVGSCLQVTPSQWQYKQGRRRSGWGRGASSGGVGPGGGGCVSAGERVPGKHRGESSSIDYVEVERGGKKRTGLPIRKKKGGFFKKRGAMDWGGWGTWRGGKQRHKKKTTNILKKRTGGDSKGSLGTNHHLGNHLKEHWRGCEKMGEKIIWGGGENRGDPLRRTAPCGRLGKIFTGSVGGGVWGG